ncbi:pre-mRNA-splicing factor CWF18, putative [Plasmodium relictum]|uniref:Pre-mRNA-splicing factor CWF18, putative n=1 Tax=Plasmodium relictum TaxID=85471 RepID=A0A1J1H929_PLARL|nr:pre-mRNA-splicing factor CWF18, putative [Plasmodium relictum]CRH01411.1 pre-mRNA-splicing factor CWF18, putative [Plasmodium relictum]
MEVRDNENLKFFNYIPINKELKKLCVPCPDTDEYEGKLDEELEEQLKNAFEGNVLDQINAKNINADLKRDLQKKLNVLSRKTDKAIIELIKRKINENNDMSTNNEDEENTSMTLNFEKKNDKNFGHVLYQTLNKLDDMDKSD